MRPQRQYTKRITRAASRSENADSEATPDKAFEHYNDENIDPNADNQLQSTISDQQQSVTQSQDASSTNQHSNQEGKPDVQWRAHQIGNIDRISEETDAEAETATVR